MIPFMTKDTYFVLSIREECGLPFKVQGYTGELRCTDGVVDGQVGMSLFPLHTISALVVNLVGMLLLVVVACAGTAIFRAFIRMKNVCTPQRARLKWWKPS